MAEEYNNENPLTMKKLAVRMDKVEENLRYYDGLSSSSDGVLEELRRIADAEQEANRRRKSMHATHIVRIALELLIVIALCAFAIGCTNELPGFIIGGENGKPGDIVLPDIPLPVDPDNPGVPVVPDNGGDSEITTPDTPAGGLRGTIWECRPTRAEEMEIIRIEFNSERDEGKIIFRTRGVEKSRPFNVVEGNLVFVTPDSIWSVTTDYRSNLVVVTGDRVEILFTRLTR